MMLKCTLVFWWKVIQDATSLWLERNAFSYAGSLAFYTLFSLAPTVIIAVTVIGVVLGEEAAHGQIVAQLQGTLGTEAALAIEQAVAQSRIEESGVLPQFLLYCPCNRCNDRICADAVLAEYHLGG